MDNTKLKQTHKHLTLIFTGVVFLIVMAIGVSFLGARFISEDAKQKKEISSQAQTISIGIQNDPLYLQKYSRQKVIEKVREFRPGDIRRGREIQNTLSFFVLDSKDNLIFKEIIEEPRFEEIDYRKQDIYTENNVYIFTQNIQQYKIIFYQNIRYSLEDVGTDILLLLFLASLLSLGVYFIGYRFVEQALRPVEKNFQDMTDFIHHAGHELKTPLAVIRGNNQIMQAEKKFDTKLLKENIKHIDTANNLIEGLRELSEVGKISKKNQVHLAIEIKKVVKELSHLIVEKKIKVHNEVPRTFYINANSQEIHILLTNVLKNAIKYNTHGGEVTFSLKKNVFSITDTGIGVHEEEQEKIFERFYKGEKARSEEGFGIGLALVKKIVEANGWRVFVKSELGVGSEFQIVF